MVGVVTSFAFEIGTLRGRWVPKRVYPITGLNAPFAIAVPLGMNWLTIKYFAEKLKRPAEVKLRCLVGTQFWLSFCFRKHGRVQSRKI